MMALTLLRLNELIVAWNNPLREGTFYGGVGQPSVTYCLQMVCKN